MRIPVNKIIFTPEMDNFLINNFEKMTNQKMADTLGLKLTRTRTRLYELGFKRMELEYWTEEQISFLMSNYHEIGDVEIAEIFTGVYDKQKGWCKKHIEKKRRYLKLKRTQEMLEVIHKRNTQNGRFSINHWKRWFDREAEIGHTVVWYPNENPTVMVKTIDGYRKLAHINWEKENGPITEGMIIRHLDGNSLNCEPSNLGKFNRQESAIYSASLMTDRYILGRIAIKNPELKKELKNNSELIELKRLQITLNRTIKNR